MLGQQHNVPVREKVMLTLMPLPIRSQSGNDICLYILVVAWLNSCFLASSAMQHLVSAEQSCVYSVPALEQHITFICKHWCIAVNS